MKLRNDVADNMAMVAINVFQYTSVSRYCTFRSFMLPFITSTEEDGVPPLMSTYKSSRLEHICARARVRACVWVRVRACVCVRARARACVCVCVCVYRVSHVTVITIFPALPMIWQKLIWIKVNQFSATNCNIKNLQNTLLGKKVTLIFLNGITYFLLHNIVTDVSSMTCYTMTLRWPYSQMWRTNIVFRNSWYSRM